MMTPDETFFKMCQFVEVAVGRFNQRQSDRVSCCVPNVLI